MNTHSCYMSVEPNEVESGLEPGLLDATVKNPTPLGVWGYTRLYADLKPGRWYKRCRYDAVLGNMDASTTLANSLAR